MAYACSLSRHIACIARIIKQEIHIKKSPFRSAPFFAICAVGYCLFLAVCFLFFLPEARSADVTLAWDASSDPQVAGYKLYYGTASRTYSNSLTVGRVTSYTVTGLVPGTIYYFAATAYDASSEESAYSNEVSGPIASSGACAYAITPTNQSFPAAGGTGTIVVTTAAGCSWTTSTGVNWVTITGGATGTGAGTVSYKVLSNSSASSRTAALTAAGRPFTINQSSSSSAKRGNGNYRK